MDVKKDTSSTIKRAQRFQVILIGEGILVGGIGGLLVLLYRLCLEGASKGLNQILDFIGWDPLKDRRMVCGPFCNGVDSKPSSEV